jgi:hypothetical protein
VPIEGDSDHWSFGQGAGYYLTATKEPWSKHYNMYDYVTKELPELVQKVRWSRKRRSSHRAVGDLPPLFRLSHFPLLLLDPVPDLSCDQGHVDHGPQHGRPR